MAAEHKSQGTLVGELLTIYNRDYEQYFYFAINERYDDNGRLSMVKNLFAQLTSLHQSSGGSRILLMRCWFLNNAFRGGMLLLLHFSISFL
jgi:hypothetical protein